MCLCSYRAQSLKVLSSIDTTIANIGDQLVLDVILKNINDNYKLDFPILSVENDSISILSQENIIEDNKITGQRFKISFWEIGEVYTPNYYVKVRNEIDKEYLIIEAERILLNIKSVLGQNDSTKTRPLKGPVKVTRVIPYKLIIKIIFLVSLIISAIIIWSRRENNILKVGNNIFRKSPIELARSKLISTNTNGFSKEFYIEISYITREFVEKSSFVRTLEMTTDEIKLNHNIFLVNKNIFSNWIILLEKADLIKYAKQPASVSEMEKDKKKALDIIENLFIKE
ncbi:MAG: hypothetical protein ACJZ1Y_00305 [Candidatus Neomarinimicrobiota bacterium]